MRLYRCHGQGRKKTPPRTFFSERTHLPRRRPPDRQLRSLRPHHHGSLRRGGRRLLSRGQPHGRVGEVESGHDFAITEDRFLVDPWVFHYYAESPVLDLTEPA